MGSKRQIAKHILPIILSERKIGQPWVEPFVGGANIIDKVTGVRLGNDIHKHLVALLSAVRDGWTPPTEISREVYYDMKANQNKYSNELLGFVGFSCSFGGKWWGGYAFNKRGDNYAKSGSKVLVKQAKYFEGVRFLCGNYLSMDIPVNSLIYCDPPYEKTKKYKDSIDYPEFWEWCRGRAKEGHTVFVSEYEAPEDFECVKSVRCKTKLNKNLPLDRVEKLFRCYP